MESIVCYTNRFHFMNIENFEELRSVSVVRFPPFLTVFPSGYLKNVPISIE